MGKRCTSPCFSLFVVVALVTHLAELLFSAMLAYTLYRDVTYRDVFFSLTAGLIILPLVLVQLVSAVFLLRRRGDAMTGGEAATTGVLHVLQLGFLWRHVTLLRKPALLIPRNELWELFVLRLTFAFAGGFPLLLLQTYLLLTQVELTWLWTVYASLVASALSVAWSMASVQQGVQETAQGQDDSLTLTLLPWPASLFTWLWRAGEMVARTLCLALFAVLYHQWVLLVLGLHWLVMLLCLSLPQIASVSEAPSSASSAQRVAVCLMTSYSYVWCYVSFSKVRTAVWYTLYYVIMFLENCTLCIVWLIKTEEDSFTSKYLLVVITLLAFLVAMACLLVFYKHFYLLPPRASSLSTDTLTTTSEAKEAHGGPGPCPACRHHHHHHHHHHQGNGKHSHPSHRPAYPPSEWSNQYRSALSAGQYYKHTMHDSLLDSASDRTSVAPHRCRQHHLHKARLEDEEDARGAGQPGGERCTCACTCACAWRGEGDGVSVVSCQTSRSANSCPHRRGGGGGGGVTGMKASRSDLTDSTSVLTLASGASHNLGYEGSDETQSCTVPAWLPSGESLIAKHLMIPEVCPGGSVPESDKEWALRQEKSMERYRCLLKQEAERWGTEGFPQHPALLDWPKLPKTHLPSTVWDLPSPDPQCHVCPCCYSHLSPGDSEVSSIFRAAHTERCPDCERGSVGTGDVLYGIPGQPAHHSHHKAHRKDASSSSSDSETVCPCCSPQPPQHHHHHHHHHHQHVKGEEKQYHSQPNVFTISQQDPGCRTENLEQRDAGKSCVSDSEGLSRKHGGLLKKNKQGEKKKQRDHSSGRTKKREASSPSRAANTPTLAESGPASSPVPDTSEEVKERTSAKHVPSKLQVKAIAEKSDDDSSPTKSVPSTSPTTSEPVYENVQVCIEDSNQLSTTSDKLSARVIDIKDRDSQDVPSKGSTNTKHVSNKHDNSSSGSKHRDSKEQKTLKDTSQMKTQRTPAERQTQEQPKKRKSSGPRGENRQHSVGSRQEAWYMCSESEDSALPPETFSSSVDDGFAGTDLDSDGSFELII